MDVQSLRSADRHLLAIYPDGASINVVEQEAKYHIGISKSRTPSYPCGDVVEESNLVVVSNYDGELTACELGTGTRLWMRQLETPVTRVEIIPSLGLVVAGDDTNLVFVNAIDGSTSKPTFGRDSYCFRRTRAGFVAALRRSYELNFYNGHGSSPIRMKNAPGLVRSVVELPSRLYVEYRNKPGKLYAYLSKSGELERVIEFSAASIIYDASNCSELGRGRVLCGGRESGLTSLWEVRDDGEIAPISDFRLGGGIWILHQRGEILVSLSGRALEAATGRILQEGWR